MRLGLLGTILANLIEWVVMDIPGPAGRAVRYHYYRRRLKALGRNVKFDVGVRILNPEFVSIGDNTWIDNYVVILAGPPSVGEGPILYKPNPDFDLEPGEVLIGSNVHVANFVIIQGHGGVKIGDDLTLASGCMIYSLSHHHSNLVDRTDRRKYKFTSMVSRRDQSLICAPVVVGRDAALGLNSILMPGVTVGAGSWIAPASLVNCSIPSNALAGGSPAEIVKSDLHPGWIAAESESG